MSPFTTIRRLKRGPVTPGLTAALVAGAALHIAGVALIGATWTMPAPPETPDVFVRVDPALNERAELFDPSPLFLPTSMNYGARQTHEKVAGVPLRDDKRNAGMDAPPLPEQGQAMPAPDGTPAPLTPRNPVLTEAYARRAAEAQLPTSSGDTFLAFGRTPPDTAALKPAGARAVLTDEATGEHAGETPLVITEIAPDASIVNREGRTVPREPAVFFVECDAYGVSSPVLRKSSGDPACDRKLAEALASGLAKRPPKSGRFTVVATP